MSEPRARSTSTALTPAEGAALVRLAATVIARRLAQRGVPCLPVPDGSAGLRTLGASFVTLESGGALRGCIGTLDAVRPLYLDVARNALRAMSDPRLPPVTIDEWPKLDVSVSALGTPEPVPVEGRDELLTALRPGVDGLILADGERRSTFLPAVWGKLADPAQFLEALLVKGGWGANGWPPGMTVARYTAIEFHDPAPRTPLL
jgi:AmmeMemoRadiSam system protein A